ncbi:MAG: Asp-tRNA(Asn)/Glu-tRNA(Gln) amidotransferase subunit GatC [Desulfovibrio sp.]|nr:Asp-tRNA(Asn)/Glu-tRNA(Gln) amidotransferase subunit GatC [Desulfovibrio sp.]
MAENKGIGAKEVAHMAQLSRLSVSEQEQELFARQLGDILGYMDVLARVDTSAVEPLYSPVGHESTARQDVAAHVCTRQEVLANAPEADGEYFMVPRIV